MRAIYKGCGSRTSMDAYQGITVLNAKVYLMLLLRCRRVDMEERMQHGFRSSRGTADSFQPPPTGGARPSPRCSQHPCTLPLWTSLRALTWSMMGSCGQYLRHVMGHPPQADIISLITSSPHHRPQ